MAETFEAVRRGPAGFEQRVCLKRILAGHSADPRLVELFLDEARLLAQMRFANIVQVHDFGAADGTYYMALELVEGADLQALLHDIWTTGQQLPEALALHIVAELLAALEYAHGLASGGEQQNIVHRDISPSNILVSLHGEVKLTDFGIAKFRNRRHRTQTGQTKGKLAYMSPEQVRGGDLDGRSDLFSLGIVLFEMLTGQHPFDGETDLELLNNIVHGRRRDPGRLLDTVDPPVRLLLDALLAGDARQRPAGARDALAMLPVAPARHRTRHLLAEPVARHRKTVTAKAAAWVAQPPPSTTAPVPEASPTAPAAFVGPGATQTLPPRGHSTTPAPATAADTDAAARSRAGGRRWLLATTAVTAVLLLGFLALTWLQRTGGRPPPPPEVADGAQPAAVKASASAGGPTPPVPVHATAHEAGAAPVRAVRPPQAAKPAQQLRPVPVSAPGTPRPRKPKPRPAPRTTPPASRNGDGASPYTLELDDF